MRRYAWSSIKNAAKRWQSTSNNSRSEVVLSSSDSNLVWKDHHTDRRCPSSHRREDGDTQSCSDEDESIGLGSDPDATDDQSEIDTILDKYLEIELMNPNDDAECCSTDNDNDNDNTYCNRRLPEEDGDSKEKRVRIGYDPDTGDVLCEYFSNDPLSWDNSTTCTTTSSTTSSQQAGDSTTWLASVDYKRFRRESQFETLVARQSSFTTDLMGLYDSCTTSAAADGLLVVDPKQVLAVSRSDHRGLELAVHFGTIMTERKAYIQQVLQTQRLQRSLDHHWTATERAEALGIQARFVSQTSRRLAHILGAGDALVARELSTAHSHLCTV
jgi:hypothetical protein